MEEQLKDLCIKKAEGNMTLEDCLNAYTKVRLIQVADAHQYKIPQSKKKTDIVDFIGAVIKSDVIRYFNEEGSDYAEQIHAIAEADG